MQNKKETKQLKSKIIKLSFIAIPIVLFAWSIWYSQGVKNERVAEMPKILEVKSDDYKKGATTTGKVVLIEYLDFECEACGAYYPILKQLEKDFPNDLVIVPRYFPLPGHRNAMPAALSVEAAGRQGKFFAMHDLLYDKQSEWGEQGLANPKQFEKYAQEIGLDMEKFMIDVKSNEVKQRVERDVKEGNILKNTGTPSFFLNGKKVESAGGYEGLKAMIQAEVDKNK
jgi:protein-disulfide isomerase